MKILVTGASGFLGSWIVRHLLAAGHEVRALVLPGDPAPLLQGQAVTHCHGDILQPDSLLPAFQGCQAVIHAAGPTYLGVSGRARLHRIHVEGTRHVCQAASLAKVPRLVHVSALAVLGTNTQPRAVSVDCPGSMQVVNQYAYSRAKIASEAVALSFNRPGLEVVCVLPSMLWGPGDINMSSTGLGLFALQRKWMLHPRSGGTSILDVEDAAQGICLALENGRPGERYLLAGDNITVPELYGYLCHLVDPGLKPRTLPMIFVKIGGEIGEWLGHMGWEIGFSRDFSLLAGIYWWAEGRKAERELGFQRKFVWQTSIERSLAWFRSHPPTGSM